MRVRGFLFWAVVFVLLGSADSVYAWGPATHVAIGSEVLARLALLPAAVAALLARNAAAYLYGTIAADVVFAKRLSRVKQFCHHWSTGFSLLEGSQSDSSRAFSLGYLSHLAADTVAHGKYVPRQITLSGASVNFGHFYWELRADCVADAAAWASLKGLMKQNFEEHHGTLSAHLKGTLLPYPLNRRLFDGINATALNPLHRRAVAAWATLSKHELSPSLVAAYREECVDRTLSLLSEGRQCPILRDDPNGTASLTQTRVALRGLRREERRGCDGGDFTREFAAAWGPGSATLCGSVKQAMPA
ncbi:MAG: hypothetical protein FLDDKLPJ_01101 [Phycisphaerae bacterium]|nr:hypothetical protein [Phycisphaerae bacterium]